MIWCQLRRLSVIKLAKVKEQSWSLLFYKLLVFHCLRSSHHLIRLSVVDSQCSRANPYAIKTVLVLQPVQISFHNVLSSQYNLKIEAFPWVVPKNFAARHWSWSRGTFSVFMPCNYGYDSDKTFDDEYGSHEAIGSTYTKPCHSLVMLVFLIWIIPLFRPWIHAYASNNLHRFTSYRASRLF